MQTARLLQAVVLMLMVAMAASCATSNEYVKKIFKPRGTTTEEVFAKKEAKPVKFLEFDSTGEESEEWVKINTDSMHNDTVAVAKTSIKPDTTMGSKVTPIVSDPLVKGNPDGSRNKKSRD